jgi:hypothetical protein
LETPSTPAVSPIRAPPDTDRRNGDTQKAVSTDGYADELDAIWNGIVATQNTMRVSLDKVGKSIKTVVAKAALFDFLVGNRGQGKRDVDFYNLIIGLTHRQNHMRLYEAVKRKVALSVTVLTSDIPRPDEATEKLIKKIAAAAAEEEEEEDEEDEEEENEDDGYNKLLKLFDLDEVEKGIVAVDEAADLADRLHKLHGKLTAERPRTEDASPRREAETPEATTPQAPFLTPPGNFSFTAAPGATPLVVTGYATGAVSKPPPPNFGTVSSAGEERNVEAKLQAPIGNRYPHRVVHQPRGGLAAIGRRKRFYANGGDEPIVGAYGHAPQNPIVPNPVLRTNVY